MTTNKYIPCQHDFSPRVKAMVQAINHEIDSLRQEQGEGAANLSWDEVLVVGGEDGLHRIFDAGESNYVGSNRFLSTKSEIGADRDQAYDLIDALLQSSASNHKNLNKFRETFFPVRFYKEDRAKAKHKLIHKTFLLWTKQDQQAVVMLHILLRKGFDPHTFETKKGEFTRRDLYDECYKLRPDLFENIARPANTHRDSFRKQIKHFREWVSDKTLEDMEIQMLFLYVDEHYRQ